MIINSVIIDDECNNISVLKDLLQKYCPQIKIIGTANSAHEGKILIESKSPELIFLDIEMSGENGFEMLSSLLDISFDIIFITAHDQFGIQAIKFSALDYLLKPIRIEELIVAVNKASIKSSQNKNNLLIRNLMHLVDNKIDQKFHKIALQSINETRLVEPRLIVRCEANNSYTTFYLENGDKITTSRPIFEYASMLNDYGFIRCHQSYLINVKYIKSWIKVDGGSLLLEDGSSIPVSRAKKDELKKILNI